MKNLPKTLLLTCLAILVMAIASNAQDCRAATVTLNGGTATLTGKTGGCVKYRFVIESGQRARVTLRSTDNNARFALQDGAEDETGSTFYEGQSSLDKVLEFEEFSIEVTGTAGVGFTLSVKVSDQ